MHLFEILNCQVIDVCCGKSLLDQNDFQIKKMHLSSFTTLPNFSRISAISLTRGLSMPQLIHRIIVQRMKPGHERFFSSIREGEAQRSSLVTNPFIIRQVMISSVSMVMISIT